MQGRVASSGTQRYIQHGLGPQESFNTYGMYGLIYEKLKNGHQYQILSLSDTFFIAA